MSELSPYQQQQQYSHKEQQTVIQITLDSKESNESIPSDTQEYPLQDVPLPSYLTIPGREVSYLSTRINIKKKLTLNMTSSCRLIKDMTYQQTS